MHRAFGQNHEILQRSEPVFQVFPVAHARQNRETETGSALRDNDAVAGRMPSEPEEYNTSRLPSLPVSNKGLTSSSFQIFAGIFETVELVLMTASTRLPIFGSSHLQTLTVTWSPFLRVAGSFSGLRHRAIRFSTLNGGGARFSFPSRIVYPTRFPCLSKEISKTLLPTSM